MADFKIDDTVDITDVVCPTTFVKAKIALEELEEGEILSVKMNDGEPVQNVPRSIKEEGHQILKLIDNEDGTFNLATRISSDDFETQVLLSETPVLTEFYSDSCIPCKRMSPLLSQIESQYGDSLKVVKVNINFDADLAKEYGVLSVPTVVFFDKGEEVERLNGLQPKDSLTEIIDTLV